MKRSIVFLLSILFLIPSAAGASVIYDSYTGYSPDLRFYNTVNNDISLAQKFTTDSGSFILSSIDVNLLQVSDGSASVSIYEDNGNELGSLLGTLTSPGIYAGEYALTSFGGNDILLSGNTSYWVMFSADSEDTTAETLFSWAYISRSEWTLSEDYASYTNGIFDVRAGNPFMMIVAANPVPVPCSILLLGSGLIGFAGLRKKIRKSR